MYICMLIVFIHENNVVLVYKCPAAVVISCMFVCSLIIEEIKYLFSYLAFPHLPVSIFLINPFTEYGIIIWLCFQPLSCLSKTYVHFTLVKPDRKANADRL